MILEPLFILHLYSPLLTGCTRENPQNLSVEEIRALWVLDFNFQQVAFAKLALQVLNGANAPADEVSVKPMIPSCLLLPKSSCNGEHFITPMLGGSGG